MTFAETIRTLRADRGLTQEQLGSAVGLTGQAVSKWETTDAMPDPTILPALADALGVTIDALFGHETRTKEKLFDEIRDYLAATPPEEGQTPLFEVLSAAFCARYRPNRDNTVYLLDRITANGICCPDPDFPYVALALMPEDGWGPVLCNPKIPGFLALMGDPDVYRAVLYLLGRDPGVIEVPLLAKKCGVDPAHANALAEKLERLGAVRVEAVEINGKMRKLADVSPTWFKHKAVSLLAAACAIVGPDGGERRKCYNNDTIPPLK